MKKGLKIVLITLITLVAAVGTGMFWLIAGVDDGKEVIVNGIDLSAVSDGTYIGKYESGRWENELSVTVKDHKIIKIDIIKNVMISKPEVTADIIGKVLDKQDTNVDIVSGATVTSKAYLKAIENALSEQAR